MKEAGKKESVFGTLLVDMHMHLPKSPWPYCTSLVVGLDPLAIDCGISISNLTKLSRCG
jgi:hypothetical protein